MLNGKYFLFFYFIIFKRQYARQKKKLRLESKFEFLLFRTFLVPLKLQIKIESSIKMTCFLEKLGTDERTTGVLPFRDGQLILIIQDFLISFNGD